MLINEDFISIDEKLFGGNVSLRINKHQIYSRAIYDQIQQQTQELPCFGPGNGRLVGDLILIKSTSLMYTVREKRKIGVEIITGEMVEEDCLKGAVG